MVDTKHIPIVFSLDDLIYRLPLPETELKITPIYNMFEGQSHTLTFRYSIWLDFTGDSSWSEDYYIAWRKELKCIGMNSWQQQIHMLMQIYYKWYWSKPETQIHKTKKTSSNTTSTNTKSIQGIVE